MQIYEALSQRGRAAHRHRAQVDAEELAERVRPVVPQPPSGVSDRRPGDPSEYASVMGGKGASFSLSLLMGLSFLLWSVRLYQGGDDAGRVGRVHHIVRNVHQGEVCVQEVQLEVSLSMRKSLLRCGGVHRS